MLGGHLSGAQSSAERSLIAVCVVAECDVRVDIEEPLAWRGRLYNRSVQKKFGH